MTIANEENKDEKINYKQAERELSGILCLSFDDQVNKLVDLGKRIGVNPPHSPENTRQKQVIYMTQSIHSFLQTKMMLSACVSAEKSSTTAKWACIWAAVAAVVSFVSLVLFSLSMIL